MMMSSFILHPSSFILLGDVFPRGPGFYFSVGKILAVLLVYLVWLRTCWWVNEDARDLSLPAQLWGPVVFGAGALGMFLVWLIPSFWVSFPILVLLYVAPVLAYVNTRNDAVRPDQRVLTSRHLGDLLLRIVTLRFTSYRAAQLAPVRFVGRHLSHRLQGTRGYSAALDLVQEAALRRASDVFLEAGPEEVAVTLLIDGLRYQAAPCPQPVGNWLIETLKELAGLNPAERDKYQLGNVAAVVRGDVGPPPPGHAQARAEGEEDELPPESRPVVFRLTSEGGGAAEKLTLRLVDRARQVPRLEELGMRPRMVEKVREHVTRPRGLVLICGPADSGKSTTLYACLDEMNRRDKTVISVEGPPEHRLEGAASIECNPRLNRPFGAGVRSANRRVPDVIGVDSIPDADTAVAACEAAAERLVVATLCAGDAVGGLGRLYELGVPPTVLADALSAVLGQRLVRVLCPACKQRYKPNAELVRRANLPADRIKFFYRPPEDGAGCDECDGTGYLGRVGVFELLVVTDALRAQIRAKAGPGPLRQEAVRGGMTYLQEDGLRQVIDGGTSIQELLRVCK